MDDGCHGFRASKQLAAEMSTYKTGSDWIRTDANLTGSGLDRMAIFLKIGGSGLDRIKKMYVASM